MFMTGQYCCSATRVLAHNSVLEETQEKLIAAMNAMVIGPGNKPQSQMGPMVNEEGRTRVVDLLESAGRSGEILCHGEPLGGDVRHLAIQYMTVQQGNALGEAGA